MEGGYSVRIHPGIYGRPRGGVNAIKRASIRPSRRTSLISKSSASLFLFLGSPSLPALCLRPRPPSSILSSPGSRSRGSRWVLLRDKRLKNFGRDAYVFVDTSRNLMTLKTYGFILYMFAYNMIMRVE